MSYLWSCSDCSHSWVGGKNEISCPECGSLNIHPVKVGF